MCHKCLYLLSRRLKVTCVAMHLLCSLAQLMRIQSARPLTEVILQARRAGAVRRAARPAGRTPPTASAAKSLFSCTSTSAWRSVLPRMRWGLTGSADAAPRPARSASLWGSAQVLNPGPGQSGLVQKLVWDTGLGQSADWSISLL